jgi:predicted ATPase
LRHARTSFVGRAEAIAKVAGLLERYHLVTVTGPGGVGKTRLVDEVAQRVAGQFADGVCAVELAAIQDPALIPVTVATALGIQHAGGGSVADAVAARLSRQQLLLVLDNCEHVLDGAAEFCARVLPAADDIRILATSREPLGLPEEARYRLPPLGVSGQAGPLEARGPAVLAQVGDPEAVTLFVERARQVDPELDLDGEQRLVVERLVRRLDGMPLAIELAAARVEALGLAQLHDLLGDRLRLLVSANRGIAARQRSLEATVDWSYRLLTDPEQRVFRFLSVFPGPFTLDAADAPAGSGARSAVLRLVDCSLLSPPRTGPDGRSRYAMLESLRGFGLDRLRASREDETAAAALAAYALAVAERAGGELEDRDQELRAARWLDAEDAALHQALAWELDHDPSAALRLAVALAPWWVLRGRWVEGRALLQRAVAGTSPGTKGWYRAHLQLYDLSWGTSDFGGLAGHVSVVVNALRSAPASAELIDGLTARSGAFRNMGSLEDALADASSALELARQIRYATGEALALAELSIIALYGDRLEEALAWARQAQQVDLRAVPARRARMVKYILPWAAVGADVGWTPRRGGADGAGPSCRSRRNRRPGDAVRPAEPDGDPGPPYRAARRGRSVPAGVGADRGTHRLPLAHDRPPGRGRDAVRRRPPARGGCRVVGSAGCPE